MISGDIKEVAIIGAGVAGLATAKALHSIGIECTVYDRNPVVGGVWADGYWEFGVQAPKDLYQFPDYPLADDVPDFTPGEQIQNYLESYVDHNGIRECLNLKAEVSEITPPQNPGEKWTYKVKKNGRNSKKLADMIVVSTGLYSENAHIPDIEGMDQFNGKIMHSSDVKDIEKLRGKRIAVIGYGKSAADIVDSCVGVASEANFIFRQTHWPIPRKLLGLLSFEWGMLTRFTAALIPPYVRSTPIDKLLHTIGYPLPWLYWRVVELLLRYQQGLDTKTVNGKNLLPKHPVVHDAYCETTMVPRPGFFERIRNGSIKAFRGGLSRFTTDGIELDDGSFIPADVVVFGTGWQSGQGFIPDAVKSRLGDDADGFYLYRHILHPNVPNLAFIGRASSFMSPVTYAIQAKWLSEVLSGNVTLPTDQQALVSIEETRNWKRSWMPDGHARSSTLLLHMSHYHDELLVDIGKDPLRKRGIFAPFKELLAPYTAHDFRDAV